MHRRLNCCCRAQPIDMVKVRIQLMGEGTGKGVSRNPFAVGGQIIRSEGVLALYKGLSAAILRQLTCEWSGLPCAMRGA